MKKNNIQNELEIITDDTHITSLLNDLFNNRTPISISFPDLKEKSSSMILEIDKINGRMLLNKLLSSIAHKHFQHSKSFSVNTNLNSVGIHFSSSIIGTIFDGNDTYYLTSLPNQLEYQQRRNTQRVSVNNNGLISISLTLHDDSRLEGKIENLSDGGISIIFPDELPSSLRAGNIIPECIFHLQNGKRISCAIEPRFVRHQYEDLPPKIGGQFVQLDIQQQKLITRFVTEMGRKNISAYTDQ